MRAQVEGGLLDRILKIPIGATLTISQDEQVAIASALITRHWSEATKPSVDDILPRIEAGKPFAFLGRTLIVA